MKKVFWSIITSAILVAMPLAAQNARTRGYTPHLKGKLITQINLGWNLTAIDLAGYNTVLNRYNQQFNNGNRLSQVGNLGGPAVSIAFYGAKDNSKYTRTMLEAGYIGRMNWQSHQESAQPIAERRLHFNYHTAYLRGGLIPISTEFFDMGLVAGVDIGLWNVRYSQSAASQMQEIQSDYTFGGSVAMPMYLHWGKVVSLVIRPYYQLMLQSADFTKTDRFLNPSLPELGSASPFISRLNNYGVDVSIGFALVRRDWCVNHKGKITK